MSEVVHEAEAAVQEAVAHEVCAREVLVAQAAVAAHLREAERG